MGPKQHCCLWIADKQCLQLRFNQAKHKRFKNNKKLFFLSNDNGKKCQQQTVGNTVWEVKTETAAGGRQDPRDNIPNTSNTTSNALGRKVIYTHAQNRFGRIHRKNKKIHLKAKQNVPSYQMALCSLESRAVECERQKGGGLVCRHTARSLAAGARNCRGENAEHAGGGEAR
ncbi:hypothetical protein BaRGS_00031945 [Batillaria attramentaria]|uniref:Ribosomal protein L28 n=1 Tax=Batillaria attramentaria TaxID=370345 RepID=A0ABD0JPW2_9CAEN